MVIIFIEFHGHPEFTNKKIQKFYNSNKKTLQRHVWSYLNGFKLGEFKKNRFLNENEEEKLCNLINEKDDEKNCMEINEVIETVSLI